MKTRRNLVSLCAAVLAVGMMSQSVLAADSLFSAAFPALPAAITGNLVTEANADDLAGLEGPVSMADKASYPTITSANYPTSIRQGSTFIIRGIVRSTTTLVAVRAGVFHDKAGRNAATSRTMRPYSTVFNLSALDPYVYFNHLAPGSYYYIVAARNLAGTRILVRKSFTVTGSSGGSGSTVRAGYPKISGVRYPTSIRYGSVFSVKGTITSSTRLTNVTAGVFLNSNATMLQTGRSVNPGTTSYSLANIDAYIYFNRLPRGTYYYIVKATNAYGSKLLVRKRFTVS